MRRSCLPEKHRQQLGWRLWTSLRWELQMEVAEVAAAREMLVVSAVAVEEAGWALRMRAVLEALMAAAVAAEARDLLEV